jgi:transposase InsO family protein
MEFFRHIISTNKIVVKTILSDRGSQFRSNHWHTFWGNLQTRVQIASFFHSQTDGISQRVIKTIKQKICLNQSCINIYTSINAIVSGINLTPTKATGFSPMTLRYLFMNRFNNEIARGLYIEMRDNMKQKLITYYKMMSINSKKLGKNTRIKAGKKVLISRSENFSNGPSTFDEQYNSRLVVKKHNGNSIAVLTDNQRKRLNVYNIPMVKVSNTPYKWM